MLRLRPTRLAYLGEYPFFRGILAAARARGLERSPRCCWTQVGTPARSYRVLLAWLPVARPGADPALPPLFQFCPTAPSPWAPYHWTDISARPDRPTLAESIQSTLRAPAPYWHGYIRDGWWVPAA